MSGKSESLLRRKRTKYYKSTAFTKTKRDTTFDIRTDYSDQKSWQDCISRIALAQQDYPEGVGVKVAMGCVESVIRNAEDRKQGYVFCSPSQLEEALSYTKQNQQFLKHHTFSKLHLLK